MILNYLKLALRIMTRNPFFTLINVGGLSIGFAVFFVLWPYSQNELRSDRQWKDAERIVRCGFVWRWTDDGKVWSFSQFAFQWPEIAQKVSEDFPEIEEMTRIFRQENFTREHIPFHGKEIFLTCINERMERVSFRESAIAYADPNVFSFFSIPVEKGDRRTFLKEVNSVVISQRLATRYFGETDPINQFLLINNEIALKVTGVFQDLPRNTHLEFEAVISTAGIKKYIDAPSFALGGGHTYFRLHPGADAGKLQAKMNSGKVNYWGEKIGLEERDIRKGEFYLQPLSEMPFVNYRWDYFKSKSHFFLQIMSLISTLILAIAWVNYLQLSVSHYKKRIKEIGIRKTSGARLLDFAIQFLLESFLINVVSMLVAFTLIQLVTTPLQTAFEFYVLHWRNMDIDTLLIFAFIFVGGILISALLPVLMVWNRQPHALISRYRMSPFFRFSNWLVTGQFCFSIVLIVWVFMVYFQIDFILKADLGINRHQVVVIDLPLARDAKFKSDFPVFMKTLESIKGVNQATSFASITGDADNNMVCLKLHDVINHSCVDTNGGVDENFIPFFKITMLAGRNFKRDYPADSGAVILSRRAVQRLGISSPEEAIGQKILVNTGAWDEKKFQPAEVIGVVEDYYGGKASLIANEGMGSGHGGIILTCRDKFIPLNKPQKVSLRVDMDQFEEIMSKVEATYRGFFDGQLFHTFFLDDHIARFYDRERTSRNQILLFTLIVIGIACLGLLGMISNKALEKTKEIGIRKALGAELHQIARLLLNTTGKQVVVAVVVGLPVANYLTQEYLQKFSQHIDLQWWHFALPIVLLIAMMLLTISSVLWRAVRSNPVDALRYE